MYQIFEAKRPIFANLYTLRFYYIIMINKYKSINVEHDWSFQIFIANTSLLVQEKTIKDISIILIISLSSILIHYDRLEESEKLKKNIKFIWNVKKKLKINNKDFQTVWIARGVKLKL